nr:SRPBCC domain-containing protein [Flavihumibacter fluvii]
MIRQPIIVERLLNAPVARVWSAITDKQEMKKWYFDLAEFKPEPGFVFEFLGGADPDIQYVHICEITEVVKEQKLTYSWKYKGYGGISHVSFELFPQGDKTLLKLTHTGIDSFPASNIDFAKGNFLEGWNHIIHTSLKEYLELVH